LNENDQAWVTEVLKHVADKANNRTKYEIERELERRLCRQTLVLEGDKAPPKRQGDLFG